MARSNRKLSNVTRTWQQIVKQSTNDVPILEVVRAEACSQTLAEAAVPAYIRIVYGTRAVRLRFRVGGRDRIMITVDDCMW
jgi:hypothetical protein